jgi:hypothetical protein
MKKPLSLRKWQGEGALIDTHLNRAWIMSQCAQLACKWRVVVLTASERTAREWQPFGPETQRDLTPPDPTTPDAPNAGDAPINNESRPASRNQPADRWVSQACGPTVESLEAHGSWSRIRYGMPDATDIRKGWTVAGYLLLEIC